MEYVLFEGRNLPEMGRSSKRKRPKNAASRGIDSRSISPPATEFRMSPTASDSAASQAQANPLLKPWQTRFETPPFDEIQPEHFLPAFEQAFADHSAEVAAITHDPSTPDFDNTVTALERSGKLLTKV
ncbi:MAG TPA: hypothetical protein VE567_02815, partial [Sphingomonas sp.]|nr:hypothetical protein [Sphingomonas sp.]